jgi:anti-anti-sigma factor
MAAEVNGRSQRSIPGTGTVTFTVPNCARVALHGEWDISNEPQLAAALQRARTVQNVVVDLSECTFLESRTVGCLLGAAQEHAEHDGRFAIALPRSQSVVNRAFDLLGIRAVLAVYRTFEDAQRSLEVMRASSESRWLEPSRPMPVD